MAEHVTLPPFDAAVRQAIQQGVREAVQDGRSVWLYGREYRPARRPVRWVAARWLHRLAERVAP